MNTWQRTAATAVAGAAVGGVLVYCALGGAEKKKEKSAPSSPGNPATAWPAGAPIYTDKYPPFDSANFDKSFDAVGEMLIDEICGELSPMYELPEAEVQWIRRMLEYNVKGGKMNRGKMVIKSIEELAKFSGVSLSPEDLSRYAVLGWAVEFMQAWLLMADDFMDDSKTRRKQPCWYLKEDVKKIAINDAFTVEMIVFKMLKRHFGRESYYPHLLDLFLETTFQTELGQLMDTLCMNLTLDDFTTERWTMIVKYKTAFYSFYCPVAMAMLVFGVQDVKAYDAAREVLIIMGVYFQAQDDFLDNFGTPEQIGKIGTDIQDKKCGWLFCQAYHSLVNADQKALLKANYGIWDQDKVDKVKALYNELDLRGLYERYEQKSYDEIMKMKPGVEELLPWSIFEIFLGKVYKRNK
eukprot:CAMPEP_0185769122 /NCGR_PEP_ID=MMETSP1174-20130828/53383_1 /TAXON_ID=35687 /ORGANISM="Dictyocha speculum, Strain CCMP1381" /LENGTH=408 /DNA_ID=CAMNT_0028454079 /DNA_START=1 /DNA_END=1227 /DNA_ORIENTATION=+